LAGRAAGLNVELHAVLERLNSAWQADRPRCAARDPRARGYRNEALADGRTGSGRARFRPAHDQSVPGGRSPGTVADTAARRPASGCGCNARARGGPACAAR